MSKWRVVWEIWFADIRVNNMDRHLFNFSLMGQESFEGLQMACVLNALSFPQQNTPSNNKRNHIHTNTQHTHTHLHSQNCAMNRSLLLAKQVAK